MKLPFAALLVSTLFAAPAFAAETYSFDPNHTAITWHANHVGFSNPSGKFVKVDGTVTLDEAKPENSAVNVTVAAGSLVTGLQKFDEHLMSKDFLDVAQFPNATFASTKVTPTGAKTAKVDGMLTLHGVSRPITLDVTLNKLDLSPVSNKKTAGFSASTVLKRSDFGVSYGVPGVSDDVKIDIEAEAWLVQP